jgi:hypothetical protein
VASLNVQLKTCMDDFNKLKFARDAYTVGRHPSIKDGLGFQREAKNLTSQRTSVLNKEKGKAPMASSPQRNHAFIYDKKIAKCSNHHKSYVHAACNNFHACNTSFVLSCKNAKVVARKLGSKCKGDKTCIWDPKTILTNLVGPNKSWVPKTQD